MLKLEAHPYIWRFADSAAVEKNIPKLGHFEQRHVYKMLNIFTCLQMSQTSSFEDKPGPSIQAAADNDPGIVLAR